MKLFTAFIFAIIYSVSYGQDLIAFKDSSKIKAKVLEIRQAEIKYKFFDYQDGPDIIKPKSDVAYVVYSNGIKEVFLESTEVKNIFLPDTINMLNQHPKQTKEVKVGDYIKFNIQEAIVIYNSFSNVPRRNYSGMTSSEEYKSTNTKNNVTFNFGFNFLFGKSPYAKHVVGINYLKTKSEFYYSQGSIGYSSDSKYKSTVDFVNVVTGVRFSLFKKLHLETLISVNFVANSKTTRSGTETRFDWQTSPYTRYTSTFENEPTHTLVETNVSLCPKISYEIPMKKTKSEVYFAYNLSWDYRLPWYQLGVHVFPFKKLR